MLASLQPNIRFLSDIVTLTTGIAAISLPLGATVVSSLAQRYGPAPVREVFRREASYRLIWIWPVVFLAAMCTRFAVPDGSAPEAWLWALLLLGVLMVVSLVAFSLTVLRYSGFSSEVITAKLLARLERLDRRRHARHASAMRARDLVRRARTRLPVRSRPDNAPRDDVWATVSAGDEPVWARVGRRSRQRAHGRTDRLLAGLAGVAAYESRALRVDPVQAVLRVDPASLRGRHQ